MRRARGLICCIGIGCHVACGAPPPARELEVIGPTPIPGSNAPAHPSWVLTRARGCGMYLYEEPPCEAALDEACCAQEVACVRDPGCVEIIKCWNYCESRRKTLGCDCFNNCTPRGKRTPGLEAFANIVDCTQRVTGWPDRCETGC